MSDETKTCTKCKVSKPLAEFPKRGNRPHLQPDCRSCRRERDALRYRRKLTEVPGFAASENRRRNEAGRKPKPDNYKERARVIYKSAVRAGQLIRSEMCEDCGCRGRIHGHHEDYSKPLSVNWLCQSCHSKRHRKYA